MKTARPFRQVRQRLGCRFSIAKDLQAFDDGFRPGRWRRDYSSENRAHFPHLFPQRTRELFLRGKAETARELVEGRGILRDGVGLLLRFNLQSVLDPAEKTIREFQGAGFGARDQFQLRENRKRFQRAGFLEESVPRSDRKSVV